MIGGKPKGDLEAPGFGEHYQKHELQPSALGTDPLDGLPKPAVAVDSTMTASPALTKKTFVCMADTSSFVLRDLLGKPRFEFFPGEVERAPDGGWYLKNDLIAEDVLKEIAAWGGRPYAKDGIVAVEPLRPQCRHYRRTLIDMQGNPDHRAMERVCMASRDENGQFVTLNDTRVHACELREPRHAESETLLDAFDEKAIAKTREEAGEFDIDAALAAEDGAGGIFATK